MRKAWILCVALPVACPVDYHIYATPSMFLVDGERTILAKPTGFHPFLREVRKLE